MTSRLLTKQELRKLYETELKDTFPPEELKLFRDMEELIDRGFYSPLAFFEADQLVAYALLWHTQDAQYALLDYLGVIPAMRGAGVGSAVLQALRDYTENRWSGVLAEVESPDLSSPEREQQKRRIRFYERAGYRYAGYDVMLFGVHYRMYVCGDAEGECLQKEQEKIYRTKFSADLYRRVVQLPFFQEEAAEMERNRCREG